MLRGPCCCSVLVLQVDGASVHADPCMQGLHVPFPLVDRTHVLDILCRCIFLERNEKGELRMSGATDWEPSKEQQYTLRRPKNQPLESLQTLEQLMQGQILIGMLTLRFQPIKEICKCLFSPACLPEEAEHRP